MDAVAAVVPELFGGGGGGIDRVPVVETEVEVCKSLLSEKDATSSATGLELVRLDKVRVPELCQPCEDASKQLRSGSADVPSWMPRHDEVQTHKRGGQVSRSGSGCSKRPRITLLEDAPGPAGINNTKETSNKLGSHPTKYDFNERPQSRKQRNNFSSKRGDRRNFKVPTKNKYDSFSVKASLASFTSAAAGNNCFGLYGLKTDVHDITKLVDDLSLNDLLQGSYECPKLGKDKGKKVTNATENFLQSVRNACSILQLPRSIQVQNSTELDSCSNEKMPVCQPSSIPMVENGDHGDLSLMYPSSIDKGSCSKPETSANLLSFSFEQPKDILDRLALPPPKDLEALLLDATKPAVSSRSTPDPRPGKQASRWPSLPPFPWSHTLNGNCRTNSDAAKLLTSRSTCQGRWVKVGNTFSSHGKSKCFTDLESLAYDDTLVPSCGPKPAVLGNNIASSTFITRCDWSSSISATSMTTHASLGSTFLKESGSDLKSHGKVEQCPRLLAAAHTLYDIATSTPRLNQDGMTKWPKKPSQKVMKARKSKSSDKPEDIHAPSTSIMGSDQMASSSVDNTLTAKRPKLSITENKKDHLHVNGVRKGPINWTTPKSSRSSPNKSIRDSTVYIVKQSCMMAPPAKVLNKPCNGQQKFRKLMQMDWKRESDRQD